MTDKAQRPKAVDLRQRAERQLARQPAAAPLSDAQTRRALHELQVHQIELQMQNEALQQAEARARNALQALAHLNEHLEAQVASRTTELVTARECAEAANRAKSVFLSTMSHELRTPMNGVLGMIELARRRASDPQQIIWLGKARRSAQHLLAVINDVLDVSKIEAGQLALAQNTFTLGPLLAELTDLVAAQATQKGLAFSVELDPVLAERPLRGDRLRLLQVLLNLASNATKFTDAGSVAVRVRESGASAAGVRLRVEVQDTGSGIAPEDQRRAFEAFEQIDDAATRRQGGTGLGLTISKHLVELMGGEIGIESQCGSGSVFWFTARLDGVSLSETPAPELLPADAESALTAAHAGARVLLAEDNPVNQEVICILLEHAGLAVDVAPDGAAAVAMACATDYALILMDLHMPVMNGPDAVRALRSVPGREKLPIIALTASVFEEDRELCIEAGMNDHIGKPVQPEVLFGTVLKWLR